MLVENIIDGDIYIKLIEYILPKCDIISLKKYNDQHQEKHKKIIDIILSDSNISIDDIVTNYSDKYLNELCNELCNKYKDNKTIFDEEYKDKFEKNKYNFDYKISEEQKKENRKMAIIGSVRQFIYNSLTNEWLDKNRESIILERPNIIEDKLFIERINHSTTYFLKLIEDLKTEILNKNSIYDWHYPISIEDISFFKDGYCLLNSITHENLCFIYCESEEEYEYLKSIGIKFAENQFIPTPKEKLYYENFED